MKISGNQTLLLVDGQSGRSEDTEVPVDLLSQSSTFIGGLPGEDRHIYAFIQDVILLGESVSGDDKCRGGRRTML